MGITMTGANLEVIISTITLGDIVIILFILASK